MRIMTVAGSLVVVGVLASTAMAQDMATSDELETALADTTFIGTMDSGGEMYTAHFTADGSYADDTGSGTYQIEDGAVCFPETEAGCYQAVVSEDDLEWFRDGESVGTGQLHDGNILGY